MLEGMLRTCVLDHKGRGLIALSGIRLRQQLSGKCTNGTIGGTVWEAIQVTDRLDRGGRELHYWSRSD